MGLASPKSCPTARAGLAPLSDYVRRSGVPAALSRMSPVRKSAKGVADHLVYQQIPVNFMDGTSPSLTHFDELAGDHAYLHCLGLDPRQAVSSHSVKRFVAGMTGCAARRLRRVLMETFRGTPYRQKPAQVVLDVDTVVYDNDTALVREGCSPTYKKVKGFQPLMIKWDGIVVWSEFREGKVHSNHGTSVVHALKVLAKMIREVLGDVRIIVTLDKDFAGELLPFKSFSHNEVWFFLMLIAFNLFELFKQGCDQLLETSAMYPPTYRRNFIDIAGKIVRHAGKTILKTTVSHYSRLEALWEFRVPLLTPDNPM